MATCPRCQLKDFSSKRRPDGVRHRAAMKAPSIATLERWTEKGIAKATDGCVCDPDGKCEHSHNSWLLILGLI